MTVQTERKVYTCGLTFYIYKIHLKVSLTLPAACRQPSYCDEWAGYGVTLLPKSPTGDVHRVNSYRTLACPTTAADGICHEGGSQAAADVAKALYCGRTWCSRYSVPTSTLAGCSCQLGDSGSDVWNSGNDIDEERDVRAAYGICASSKPAANSHGELPSAEHDANFRCFLTRPPQTDLLGDLGDNMTSSRDFLVATDSAIGHHAGIHDNNNNGDDDDDDED